MTEHDDRTIAHSGSRWEPQPGAPTHEIVPTTAAGVRPVRRGRRRAALVGAVVALFALGGIGGLALGHTTGTGDDAPHPGVVQGPSGDDGVPLNVQGDDGADDDGDGTT